MGGALFERRFGVETSGRVELEELGLDTEDRNYYEPAEWQALRRILPKREVSREDVFIDFGSGMGRVVLLAAQYDFARVIGVEISERLTRIAEKNLERNRNRVTCGELQLVTADVVDYQIPDDVTIAFFNNPFYGEVFDHVTQRLLGSVDRNPRRLRIIYRNPMEEERLLRTGRVQRVRESRKGTKIGRPYGVAVRMYEVQPS